MQPFRLDHVAYVVPSLSSYITLYERIFDAVASSVHKLETHGVKAAFLVVGSFRIEVIEPLSENVPLINFLNKHGPGFHHIAFSVPSLRDVCARLQEDGYRFTTQTPLKGSFDRDVIFLHPHTTEGLLVEFCEEPWYE